MSLPLKKKKIYTYQDYLGWPDEERWELINGEAYNMTPAPTTRHQKIAGRFNAFLEISLKNKSFTPFIAPTDVILSKHDVVQPDVFVVCDKNKITDANIQGAPDLIIEILSPSTLLKDIREKKECYEKYGVKEYIIVHPIDRYVERFFLRGKKVYGKADILGPDETLSLLSLKDIKIFLKEIFDLK